MPVAHKLDMVMNAIGNTSDCQFLKEDVCIPPSVQWLVVVVNESMILLSCFALSVCKSGLM